MQDNPRPDKAAVVAEVKERLEGAEAVVLTEYRGLDVPAMAELRKQLREAGGEYKVYKNRLVKFAAQDLGLAIDDLLVGPTALAFAKADAVAVAKALKDYSGRNADLVIKGGLLGTQVLSEDEVTALSKVPPREDLMAQFAGLVAAPLQEFAGLLEAPLRELAGLLEAVPRELAGLLQALIDEGGAAEAPAAEPEPEAAPEPEASAEAEPEAAPEPEASAEAEPEAAPEPEAEPEPEAAPEPEASAEPEDDTTDTTDQEDTQE